MHLTTNCSIYYYFTHTISVLRPGVHLVKAEVSELVILAEYYVHYKFDATLKVDCCPSLNTQSCIRGLLGVRDFCFWAV